MKFPNNQQVGMRIEGESLPEFTQRLELCGLGARIAMDHARPVAVHWTQSNMLLAPETFEAPAAMGVPSPLHIHRSLFGTPAGPEEEQALGLRTFGMRHFIGHEVIVEPTTLPWSIMWESALVLLRVATVDNGYIIPDGDTFGDESRSQSFRVRHLAADEGGVPLLELTPLKIAECGFGAPDYAPEENVCDDRLPPPAIMPADEEEKMDLTNEWREKRAMAEGIGGRFGSVRPGRRRRHHPLRRSRRMAVRQRFRAPTCALGCSEATARPDHYIPGSTPDSKNARVYIKQAISVARHARLDLIFTVLLTT